MPDAHCMSTEQSAPEPPHVDASSVAHELSQPVTNDGLAVGQKSAVEHCTPSAHTLLDEQWLPSGTWQRPLTHCAPSKCRG